jgi:hypothetical protein
LILVDASVLIDHLRGLRSPQAGRLRELADQEQAAIGDLTLAEVLRGCRDERDAEATQMRLLAYPLIEVGGREVAVAAAANYRALRMRGRSVRGLVDLLLATRCILGGHALLFADRDFAPFVEHLGLIDAMALGS